jgi:hypothetical protein
MPLLLRVQVAHNSQAVVVFFEHSTELGSSLLSRLALLVHSEIGIVLALMPCTVRRNERVGNGTGLGNGTDRNRVPLELFPLRWPFGAHGGAMAAVAPWALLDSFWHVGRRLASARGFMT